MIPHSLQIKNFLSYGAETQTIDFTPYHLIYLSGKNGHGKSALLDAMTWAIWGIARKVSTAVKADEGLLRLGQTQMMVVLDFELDHHMYRVKREFNQVYGKATTNLEFGMINPETKEFIPLTDKTIRATQAKIEQTIRLDYEAFVNSAFLRQGHANEFSQKSPKERKEILGSILGLGQFDLIKKRALEKAKEAHTKKITLQQFEATYQEKLTQQTAIEQELKQITADLNAYTKKEEVLSHKKITIDKERSTLLEQKKQHELLAFKHTQYTKELNEKLTTLRTLVSQWRSVNRKKNALPDYAQLQQKKSMLTVAIKQHQEALQQRLHVKEALLKSEKLLHEKTVALQHTLSQEQHKFTIEHNKSELEYTSAEKQYQELTTKIKLLSQKVSTLKPKQCKQLEAQFEKRKEAYQQFITEGKWFTAELQSLKQKSKLVHTDDPSCPLCEQNLSAARKKFLKNKFTKQYRFWEHRIQRLARIVTKLKSILLEQHKTVEKNKELLRNHAELTELESVFTKQKTLLESLKNNTEKSKQLLDQQSKKAAELIKADPAIKKINEDLVALQKKLTETVYNEANHKQAQNDLEILEKQINEFQEVQQQISQQEERYASVVKTINDAKQVKQHIAHTQKEQKKFAPLSNNEKELETKERAFLKEQQLVNKEKETLLQKKGSLENQKLQLKKIEDELGKQKKEIDQLNIIIQEYQIIAAATGKDGIQALLIEEAIPEIEQEANQLLSKLTNNQAQIFIESVRGLKKGGSKETLEIKISDPSGIRAYELFSGGEAFRIDFALRIAISKLLARRAGTALQTLIIDEGFGSQDEEGLGHIMDAIYKIQDDFEKVIVVSHLPSMKDQFPVHFMVEKNATGSHINIVEQG